MWPHSHTCIEDRIVWIAACGGEEGLGFGVRSAVSQTGLSPVLCHLAVYVATCSPIRGEWRSILSVLAELNKIINLQVLAQGLLKIRC